MASRAPSRHLRGTMINIVITTESLVVILILLRAFHVI
jgi:hypothetical protein